METRIAEIAEGLDRLPRLMPQIAPPAGFEWAHMVDREDPTPAHECFGHLGFPDGADRIPDVPSDVDLSLDMLPGIMMATGRMRGSRPRRTRFHVEDGTDAILLVGLRGQHLVEQRNRDLVLGDGEAVLVSASDRACFTHNSPGDILMMCFAKADVGPPMKRGRDGYMRRIPRDTRALGLLTDYLATGWGRFATARPERQHLMARHIHELIALIAGAARAAEAGGTTGGRRAARLHAMKHDVERWLDQPNLSVAALAERHCCTPRQVQRLFEQEGSTFTEYVHAQRLGRAYCLLSDRHRCSDKISSVALDCGFGDVSYFKRVFRRRFGAAPSDVRAQARHAPATVGRRDN